MEGALCHHIVIYFLKYFHKLSSMINVSVIQSFVADCAAISTLRPRPVVTRWGERMEDALCHHIVIYFLRYCHKLSSLGNASVVYSCVADCAAISTLRPRPVVMRRR